MKIKIKIGKIFCGLLLVLVGLTFLGVSDSRANYEYEVAYDRHFGGGNLYCPYEAVPGIPNNSSVIGTIMNWYKAEGRCGEGKGLKFWHDKIYYDGEITSHVKSEFDAEYDSKCQQIAETTDRSTCHNELLCSSGYEYRSNTKECRKSLQTGGGTSCTCGPSYYTCKGVKYNDSCGNLICDGTKNCSPAPAPVTPAPVTPVNLIFSANPTTITLGDSTTIAWNVTNADSCAPHSSAGAGDWATGYKTASGYNEETVRPTFVGSHTYVLECTNSTGGYSKEDASVDVLPPPPTLTFTASPAHLELGDSTTLSWTVNGADSCRASEVTSGGGTWTGSKPFSDETHHQSVEPTSTGFKRYKIKCSNISGSIEKATMVHVSCTPNCSCDANTCEGSTCPDGCGGTCNGTKNCDPPNVSISAHPSQIIGNGPSVISYTVNNATYCYGTSSGTGAGTWAGIKPFATGAYDQTVNVSTPGSKSYTITCTNPYGADSESTTINVEPPTVNIDEAPTAYIDSPSGNRTIDIGDSISFSGHGTDPDGDSIDYYQWFNGNCFSGSTLTSGSTRSSFSRTFSTPGTYTISLEVRANGKTSSNCPSRTITVREPVSYSCTGDTPSNATICPSDNTGLTSDVSKTLVNTCTSRKCEYTCDSGYTLSSGSCVAISSPTISLSASPTTIDLEERVRLAWTVNNATSCTASVNSGGGDWTGYRPSLDNRAYSQFVTPTSTGSKTYRLTCSNGFRSTVSTANVQVIPPEEPNQPPLAYINRPSGNRTIDAGEPIDFSGYGIDPDGSVVAYEWRVGNCVTGTRLSTRESFTHNFSSSGSYRVFFRVRDDDGAWGGCPSRNITVNEPICTDTCSSLGYSCGTHTICGVSTNCGSCSARSRCRDINYICSDDNVYQETGRYQRRTCSGSGRCYYRYQSWLDYICDGVDQPCGNETCKDPYVYQYCGSNTEILGITQGYKETCTPGSSGGCGVELNSDCYGTIDTVKVCEEGEFCAEVSGTQENGEPKVDCVPKATNWTEE